MVETVPEVKKQKKSPVIISRKTEESSLSPEKETQKVNVRNKKIKCKERVDESLNNVFDLI